MLMSSLTGNLSIDCATNRLIGFYLSGPLELGGLGLTRYDGLINILQNKLLAQLMVMNGRLLDGLC